MTLRWKEFERRAKKLARAEIRRSPKLKAQRKYNARPPRQSNQTFLFQFLVTMFAFAPLLMWIDAGHEAVFAALSVSITGAAFLTAMMWHNRLYYAPDVAAFLLLPLTSDAVFRIQSRRIFRTTTLVFASFVLLYGVAFAKDGATGLANALILALGQTLLTFAVVAHILIYFPRGLIPITGLALTFGWAVASVALMLTGSGRGSIGWTPFTWFLPPSWLHQLYFALSGDSSWTRMFFALPIAVIFALTPHAFDRLRRSYVIGLDQAGREEIDEDDSASTQPTTADASNQIIRAFGPTELAERAEAGHALPTPTFPPAGFIERFLLRRLNERERLVVTFLWRQPNWTRQWKWSIAFLAAICALAFLIPSGHVSPVMMGVVALIFGQTSLPLAGGGVGFTGWPCGGTLFAAQFGFVPISFDEMFRVSMKINFLRLLVAAPFWILFSACVGHIISTPASAALGAIFGVKFILAIAALQPFLFAMWLGTSVNIKRKFWTIPFVLIFIGFMAAGGLFWLGMLDANFNFVNTPIVSAASLLSLAILSFLWNLYFRWLYRGKRIDALVLRRQ
ncbi:MAG TPA: hypothetical protein VI282_07060 [Verrucomicrobiae bacterium]